MTCRHHYRIARCRVHNRISCSRAHYRVACGSKHYRVACSAHHYRVTRSISHYRISCRVSHHYRVACSSRQVSVVKHDFLAVSRRHYRVTRFSPAFTEFQIKALTVAPRLFALIKYRSDYRFVFGFFSGCHFDDDGLFEDRAVRLEIYDLAENFLAFAFITFSVVDRHRDGGVFIKSTGRNFDRSLSVFTFDRSSFFSLDLF